MVKIGVMASGSGSNFQSIIDNVANGNIPDSEVVLLICDKAEAGCIMRAKKAGIDAVQLNPASFPARQDFDLRAANLFERAGAQLICLAGYMRIVTRVLLDRFPNAVMNIHPALLPSFTGLEAQAKQLEYGVKVSGCTVHFVDDKVDHGPIIAQAAVSVLESDTKETLSKRILEKEHIIYSKAIRWFAEKRLKIEGRRVRVQGVMRAGSGLRVL